MTKIQERILAFTDERNVHAHPFNWTTKSFDKILAKIDPPQVAAA